VIKVIPQHNGTLMFPIHLTRIGGGARHLEAANVLKMPVSPRGRALLREYGSVVDVWAMPVDWDVLGEVIDDLTEYERKQERELQDFHDWCIATGKGAPW